MAHIDYFFYSASPFTSLGHQALLDLAARHGATVAMRPVALMGLWEQSGAVPPAKRPPVRQRYRIIELQRMAEWRGLPLNVRPAFFPVDATLADLMIAAMVLAGRDPAAVMGAIFAAVWAEEKNIADEAVLRAILEAHGEDADALIAAAKGPEAAAMRADNTEAAKAADAVGVPAYVLNGEVFWGQDRIEHLDRALEQGRAPFRADA